MGDSHVVKLRASIYSTLGRALEAIALHKDMHPANVFVESLSGKPVCIDCIVKFR